MRETVAKTHYSGNVTITTEIFKVCWPNNLREVDDVRCHDTHARGRDK